MKKKLKTLDQMEISNDESNTNLQRSRHDNSPIVPQRPKLKGNLNIFKNFEFTQKQKDFLDIALDKNTKMVFVEGPAGCSKTFLTIYSALRLLNEKKVSDIIYARSAIECSDRSLGFLPGNIDEKMGVYNQPLIDKLNELLSKNDIELLKKESRISGIPISYLRGLSWNCKVIIGDEFQNCTYKEIVTFITRMGQFSKIFILGDVSQNDINGKSGFQKTIDLFNDEESKSKGIFVFKFTEDDIVRCDLLKFIIKKIKSVA
jgi:phosphate starvation-inducible protein PhoH and related proteins